MHHGARIVAVCDVDQRARRTALGMVERFYKTGPGGRRGTCAAYSDFRELLADDTIDAVMIATPDHTHVPVAAAAVKAGKDIYVEKPLGVSIAEGRALVDIVDRCGAVFMHGTEQRCMRQFRFACELVRNGRIGDLHTIRVACPGGREAGVQPPEPAPRGFDYDLWLGPAPYRPYSSLCCHRQGWYFISDYAASGFMAGWGIHHLDIVQWALDVDDGGPSEIDARAVFPSNGPFDTPLSWLVEYGYGQVRVVFTDNGHRAWKWGREGIRFEGTEGWVYVTRGSIDAGPEHLLREVIGPDEVKLPVCDNDDRNFVECVKSRGQTLSPAEVAHRSTAVGYLGHISALLGRKLDWDPRAERFVEDGEADRLLCRSMRKPWRL
jgi:predicted dehydrogenase